MGGDDVASSQNWWWMVVGFPMEKEVVIGEVVVGLEVVWGRKEGWTTGFITKEGAGGVESTKEMMGGMTYLR